MAIRTNTNPRQMDLQPEMRDLLRRNGMQAHVVSDGTGYRLLVQGHDSPLLTYPITERQMLALTDWGTNTANKKAYNVFTSIVGNDFYMPKNFVHARNANGRVAMGLHGYRIGIGEYGRVGRLGMPPPFLGWTPRHQWGFHLRRVGGQLFYPGVPIVPERWDGRMKPGELQSGGYGFYYKGGRQTQPAPMQQTDVLQNLQAVITPMVSRPRSQEPARPYKELITSPVYFSNEKWQECLASHGLIVDAEARTLTVQSEQVAADMVYDLKDDELGVLTSNVHMAWMRAVCGRLKSDYRYSKDVVYNNFPWPAPTEEQRTKIEQTAQGILDARALYPDSSLADLYDETTMPPELRRAHQENDKAVMRAYGFDIRTTTETSCVAELMRMYQALTKQP